MSLPRLALAVIGDEIGSSLDEMISFCAEHEVRRLDMRTVEGRNLLGLSLDEGSAIARRIEQAGGFTSEWKPLKDLAPASAEPLQPPMQTLQIVGGRKEKIRPGDVLGALTKDLGFAGTQIGKINVNEFSTYVAVERSIATQVLRKLSAGKVKGRSVKLRLLES